MQRVIGLMSGTSADGIDAALVEIQEDSLKPQVYVLAHATYPYDATLRAQILAASYPQSSGVDLICHLNVALGECFAAAAMAVAHTAGVPLEQIDLIGSHGQAIYHIPEASTTPPRCPSTLLAHATVYGRPGNVPGATGARRAVVLGKIVPA